jgi:hypothetical protein
MGAFVPDAGHRGVHRPGERALIVAIPYFWSCMVSGLSLESTMKTANRLAGWLSLAFSLTV